MKKLCMILSLSLALTQSVSEENEEEMIVISERVGDSIDLRERNYYNFLPSVKGYKSARFLRLSDERYVIEVTYEKDDEEKVMRIDQSKEDIEKIRYQIDRYEEIMYLREPGVHGLRVPKSKTAAVMWSVGATIIPSALGILLTWSDEGASDWRTPCGWTMIIGGPIIGPSAGHFYAEQWFHGVKTAGARLALGGTGCISSIVLAILIVKGVDPEDLDEWAISAIPTGLACIAVIGHGVYDIITVPRSVRKYNEKLQLGPEINLKEKRYGIGVVYRF